MADDSFTSQDINELRAAHDHLVSTNDPRAPKLRSFLQSQNAMGPPPPAFPLPGGLGGPPLAGLGVPAPVSIPMYNRGGQIKETGAPLSTAESLAMAPLGYISGGAEQLGRGMTQMHEAQTGSQFAGGLSDFILGGGRLATPAALPEVLPAVAAAPWSSALRAMAGLGTGFGLEELNQRLVPPEYQGYGDLASTLAGIKAAQASPETLLRAGKAGLSGLGAYGREIHLFKPLTPFTGLGSAWDAARASWEAGGPEPLTGAPTSYPSTYGGQTSSTARFNPPEAATEAPKQTRYPSTYGGPTSSTARFNPPVEATGAPKQTYPATYGGPTSSTGRFNPPEPATGAPAKRTTIGRLQFKNRFWTAPEGEGEEGGEGEGIPPAGPKKGTPVNPVDKMDRTALNATLHSEAQDLDIAPVGGLRGAGPKEKVPSGFMDIVAKDKFGKPYRELSDDQLRQMINDRTLHNYKVK